MKVLSHLKIVTITDERAEYETDCMLEFCGGGAVIEYSTDDGDFTVKIADGKAMIKRTGNNGYVLNLVKGERSEFSSSVGTLQLYTKEMLFRICDSAVKFAARYEFDGGHEIRIIIKTAKK